MSPTERTLWALRGKGWHAEVVERWIPRARLRKDLWGWCDILALKGPQILAVQCTSRSNVAARVRKISESPLIDLVREAGIRVEVWGWGKLKSGWTAKVVDLS